MAAGRHSSKAVKLAASWSGLRLRCSASAASTASRLLGQPLLQPSASVEGAIELNHSCSLDLSAEGVPTLALIGPSRRGKSVLSSLLAGGNPNTFQQSHSSFRAMTNGTHIFEVPGRLGALPVRVIDTEGLSHVGRSRVKEAMVRQFLISTYLTSSSVIWLDTEVLSSSFFTMMWLVYDYVVDVLKIKDAAGSRLPRLMYIRTQETDVQRREYETDFQDFGQFFEKVLEEHEDAQLLRQMFAPDGIQGHALPVWTSEDLEAYEGNVFWTPAHNTPFRASVENLQSQLLSPLEVNLVEGQEAVAVGPPLLALESLEQHLPRIARLEAFDPRDHESTKVSRIRAQLRASYGRPMEDGSQEAFRLANQFDPNDRPVRANGGRIDLLARARLEEQCKRQRLDVEEALADREVALWLHNFSEAQAVFSAAVDAFAGSDQTQRRILHDAIESWQLDPDTVSKELAASLAVAEEKFLSATGLGAGCLKTLGLREQLSWRYDECVLRLRGKVASELELRDRPDESKKTCIVWRLGRWEGSPPKDGKSRYTKGLEYALWTDGCAWELYTERQEGHNGLWTGILQDQGITSQGALPVPQLRS